MINCLNKTYATKEESLLNQTTSMVYPRNLLLLLGIEEI